MTGLYEQIAKTPVAIGSIVIGKSPLGEFPSYKGRLDRRLTKEELAGLFDMPEYRVEFVPYSEMLRTFGDFVGYRTGDQIVLATDYKDRKLTPAEIEAHFLHEHFAGHDHKFTDEQAQAQALKYAFARAQMDKGYAPVVDVIRQENERLGFMN